VNNSVEQRISTSPSAVSNESIQNHQLPPRLIVSRVSLCTDFTAAAIIDNFSTQATTDSVERVMKQLANEKASEIMKNREPKLPSGMSSSFPLSLFPN